jgi:prepilin-type N-terminal cleavage/methylation domain-containing protein
LEELNMTASPRSGFPVRRANDPSSRRAPGFTVVELLVVIAILVVLVGILLVALSGGRAQAEMTKSMTSLKQIANWMTLYSSDNRDHIVPSQFNYQHDGFPDAYKGKVRSVITAGVGELNRGTWTDILWTRYADTSFPEGVGFPDCGHDYKFDSPDNALYKNLGDDIKSPFRSSAKNSRNTIVGQPISLTVQPFPFGPGAQARGEPGFFAANNFFNADPESPTFNDINGSNGWWTNGQIALPAKSLYLVDSVAGEVIEVNAPGDPDTPDCAPWNFFSAAFSFSGDGVGPPVTSTVQDTGEVDFRYQDAALILYLDSHVKAETRWNNLDELQSKRGIRVRQLNSGAEPESCPP